MVSHERPSEERSQGKTDKPTKPAPTGIRAKRRKLVAALVAVAVAIAIVCVASVGGYWIGLRQAGPRPASNGGVPDEPQAVTTWYCSMHPQITSPKPGKCAICFMDLIPLEEDTGGDLGPRQLKMSKTAMALAKIQTTRVERRLVAHEVRMQGKIDYDETRLVDSTAWIPGRLDRLFVDYTGVLVREGDHLFEIYSPKLVVAQDELLLALKALEQSVPRTREEAANNLRLVEEKLRLWGLLDEQIEEIRKRGKASDRVTIYAPVGGIVIRKNANKGAYVQQGTPVYTIADLSLVWVYLDAYESDVAWLRYGQEVEFTTESYPGDVFKGRIAFIDPALTGKSRVVRVRVNVPNADSRLKPGMFVRAVVRSRLAAGGQVLDPVLAGKWICPMHPEIVKDGPSGDLATGATAFRPDGEEHEHAHEELPDCDVCGMDLVPARELGLVAPEEVPELPLVVPVTAPLQTGKRAVVYVKLPDREEPVFEGREVLLGHRAGDYYIVRHGLE
ncbi:MAG: efflux RND transporter periplasmic adaptor subunit, partial [Planctomycetes bacterium]|nr:efflux RND transporter periplasmic adaptor subunit [Planctomycetota bacterium]